MIHKKFLPILLFLLLSISIDGQNIENKFRSEFYAQLPFWESPYQPFKGSSPITKKVAAKRIHLKIDYDYENRIVATHVMLGKHYKEFEGFFGNIYINAPLTTVHYEPNRELHRFYDRFGNQISVQGNVHIKVYQKDEYGRNVKLTFLDSEGIEIADQTGVKSYNWTHSIDGSIIENRFNEKGEIVPLRGYFDLERTRMIFDNQGYFRTLQNIDENGVPVNTKNGVATYHYYYDGQGRFEKWEVLDEDGNKTMGPSNTAGEQNTYYQYELEDIIFFDTIGNPATHWSGAQRWHFNIDDYGNFTSLEFQDVNGDPMNGNNGYSKCVWNWTEDGRFMIDQAYFDKSGKRVVHNALGVHKAIYVRNNVGLIVSKEYQDVNGNLANRLDSGGAREEIIYDSNNVKSESRFYDQIGHEIKK